MSKQPTYPPPGAKKPPPPPAPPRRRSAYRAEQAERPERDFQAAVVVLAKTLGWTVYYTTDSRHSPAGWVDLVLIRGDRVLFRENKRDSRPSRVTAAQRECMALLEGAGLDVGVWTPDDWQAIADTLAGR